MAFNTGALNRIQTNINNYDNAQQALTKVSNTSNLQTVRDTKKQMEKDLLTLQNSGSKDLSVTSLINAITKRISTHKLPVPVQLSSLYETVVDILKGKSINNTGSNVDVLFASTATESLIKSYKRDFNNNLVNSDGKLVNSQDVMDEIKTNGRYNNVQCVGTSADNEDCTDLLNKCMLGDTAGIKECKTFFEGLDSLTPNTRLNQILDAVKSTHPELAKRTLNNLKVPTVTEGNITKYVSKEKWIEQLKDTSQHTRLGINSTEADAIANQVGLCKYVDALIKFVNSEPAILNSNYNVQAMRSNSGIKKFVKTPSNFELTYTMLPQRFPMSQFGGDDTNKAENILNKYGMARSKQIVANLIESNYNSLKNQLKTHNKDIAAADNKKIEDLINKLKQDEGKLNNVIDIMKILNDLHASGTKMDESTIRLEDMLTFVEQNVEKLQRRIQKKETNITVVLQSLADIIRTSGLTNLRTVRP